MRQLLAAMLVLVLCSFAYVAISDEDRPFDVFWSYKKSLVIIGNQSTAHVKFEVPCKKFQHDDRVEGVAFFVWIPRAEDKLYFQAVLANPKDFSNESGNTILEKHMEFERKYWQEASPELLTATTLSTTGTGSETTLLWEVKLPKKLRDGTKVESRKQLYLTRVVGDRVLCVSVPVMKYDSEQFNAKWLSDIGKTFQVSEERIDAAAIKKALRDEESAAK